MFFFKKTKKSTDNSIKADLNSNVSSGPAEVQIAEEMNECELVSIFTAAIMSSLNQSTYNLRVKSFRRVEQNSPVWNSISRKDLMDSRI